MEKHEFVIQETLEKVFVLHGTTKEERQAEMEELNRKYKAGDITFTMADLNPYATESFERTTK